MSETVQTKIVFWSAAFLATTVVGLFIAWLSWMSLKIISLDSKMEVLTLQQQNVISPVVESSFKEIRDKTNREHEMSISTLKEVLQLAVNNRQEINGLQKEIEFLKTK